LADAPSKPLSFLFLGVIFDVNGTIWNLLVAWSTARLSSRFAAGNRFKTWFNRCIGSLFVVIGIRLALAHDR
jgi:threonine/homoserine/homoserine lactone efflux protein